MVKLKQKILIVHTVSQQEEEWFNALNSEELALEQESPEIDIVESFKMWQTEKVPLPTLVLMDITVKSPLGNFLQVSSLARWVKEQNIPIKIIALNPKVQEISSAEKNWASRQGLTDILPKINTDNREILLHRLEEILGITLIEINTATSPLPPPEIEPESAPESTETSENQELSPFSSPSPEEILESINQALSQNQPNAEFIYCQRGEIYWALGKYQEALQDFNRAIQLNPNFELAYLNRGTAFQKLGEHRSAIADLDKVLKLNPKNLQAYRVRGLARFRSGDERGARRDYDQAIKIKPDFSQVYNDRATLRYALGDTKEALKDYENAIRHDLDYADAYYNRGNIYSDLGNFAAAIEDYTQAIRCKPSFASAYGNRGIAYYELDQVEAAIQDTSKAVNLFHEQGEMESYRQALETLKQMQ